MKAITGAWQHGRFLIILGALCFTIMDACVKAAAPRIPLLEIVFIRSLVSVLILAFVLPLKGLSFRSTNYPMITLRSISGFLAICCNFYGLSHLSLSDAVMLIMTFPLFVAILSILFLKERPTRQLIMLIILAWIGILIILQPQVQVMNFAGFIALLAAVFSSIDVISMRVLRRSENPLRITFYLLALSSLITFPFVLYDSVAPMLNEWSFLIAAGITGTLAQVFISQAYGLDDASRLAPLSYISVVFSFIIGIIFWNEIPTVLSVIGTGIVIYGCIRIARLEKVEPTID